MKKIELNTGICRVVSVSTYGTYFDALEDDRFEYNLKEDLENGNYGEIPEEFHKKIIEKVIGGKFEFSDYLQDICKRAISYLEENCLEHWKNAFPSIEKIEYKSHWSPKEYNFQGDEMDFTVHCDVRKIRKELKKFALGNTAFFAWLHDTWKSRDGFISFVPHDEYDWFHALALDDKIDYCLGTALHYIIWKEKGEDLHDFANINFYYYCEDLYIDQYYHCELIPEYWKELQEENGTEIAK
jgi:hypothetical protein